MFSHNNSQTNQVNILYRHGDVLIGQIDRLPKLAQKRDGVTLAQGELTGHSHRFAESDRVQLWEQGNNLFLEVKEPSANLIHEEHRAISIPQGLYRVWRQREYRPDAYVEVED